MAMNESTTHARDRQDGATLDPPPALPVGQQAVEGFGADTKLGGHVALALRKAQLVALLFAQRNEIRRQPLLGGAAGQPLHLVHAVIEPQAEALQQPHGQWGVILAGGAQCSAREPPDGQRPAAGPRTHRVAAMLHEHGGIGHQRPGSERLEHVFVTLLAEAHHFQLARDDQQIVGGAVALVKGRFTRAQRLRPCTFRKPRQHLWRQPRKQRILRQQLDERCVRSGLGMGRNRDHGEGGKGNRLKGDHMRGEGATFCHAPAAGFVNESGIWPFSWAEACRCELACQTPCCAVPPLISFTKSSPLMAISRMARAALHRE